MTIKFEFFANFIVRNSWWTFRIFFFFCSGEGKGEPKGPGGGGGTIFHGKSQEGGGWCPRRVGAGGRGAGRLFEGNLGGGGPKYFFFRGRNSHQEIWLSFGRLLKLLDAVTFWPRLETRLDSYTEELAGLAFCSRRARGPTRHGSELAGLSETPVSSCSVDVTCRYPPARKHDTSVVFLFLGFLEMVRTTTKRSKDCLSLANP